MKNDADLSYATWSAICEPGDEFGGMLRAALGVQESLRLVQRNNSNLICEAIQATELAEEARYRFVDLAKTAADGLQRWMPRVEALKKSLTFQRSISKFHIVHRESSIWPSQLDDLGWGAPAALWIDGQTSVLQRTERSVAIVGARSSTRYGEWVTADMVAGLSSHNFVIVSGGAYGIDGAAHRAALGIEGDTIAVLAGGVDRLYPSGHQNLLLEIAKRGLLVSELPPGSSPTKWRFLQRNRLIAALTRASVVVEAGWRSGSINTANHASNLGRQVGAVPGPVTSPSSAGCHRLIRDGVASLVATVDDALELLGETAQGAMVPDSLGALETRAIDSLGSRPKALTEVAKSAGLTIGEASMALASLEILGLAESSYGKWSRTTSNL